MAKKREVKVMPFAAYNGCKKHGHTTLYSELDTLTHLLMPLKEGKVFHSFYTKGPLLNTTVSSKQPVSATFSFTRPSSVTRTGAVFTAFVKAC